MGRYLLYIAFIFIISSVGCKKKSQNYTSVKMNGNWIWIGTPQTTGAGGPPDVFVQFSVTVVNDVSVIVPYSNTLNFQSIDPTSHAIIFYHRDDDPNAFVINAQWLSYDPVTNAMHYISEQNSSMAPGPGMDVSNSVYKPNPSLKDYVPNIAGTKMLSGAGYYRHPNFDSSYILNTSINFTIVNDSTITFDKNFLNLSKTDLHYKSKDDVAQTVTYQTFHDYFYEMSTLTYNYVTRHIVFEQRYFYNDESIDLILQ